MSLRPVLKCSEECSKTLATQEDGGNGAPRVPLSKKGDPPHQKRKKWQPWSKWPKHWWVLAHSSQPFHRLKGSQYGWIGRVAQIGLYSQTQLSEISPDILLKCLFSLPVP